MPLTYQNGSLQKINVPKMDFEEMVSYLKRKIARRFTHLYYALPPNNISMKSIKSDYDTDVMYDIAKVAGKIQIYFSHHPVDLSMELIPNDGSLEEAYAGVISEETKIKQQESLSGKLVINATKTPVYVNGGKMNITVPRMKLKERKQYLFNIIAQGKLEIYVNHVGVNFVIAKYIYPNATLAEMMNHVITDYTSDNEDERNELVDHLYVEMCNVGNHIVHTLETVVCDVSRMVEIRMGSDGKFVTRIGFVRTFVMGIGYDMMVAMGVSDKRLVALVTFVSCLMASATILLLAPYLDSLRILYFWEDLVVGCPFEVE
ncbi:hypothetical protein Tco_0557964 [Tanacetum coccineum]